MDRCLDPSITIFIKDSAKRAIDYIKKKLKLGLITKQQNDNNNTAKATKTTKTNTDVHQDLIFHKILHNSQPIGMRHLDNSCHQNTKVTLVLSFPTLSCTKVASAM